MWAERSCVRFWPETRRGEAEAHPHLPGRPPDWGGDVHRRYRIVRPGTGRCARQRHWPARGRNQADGTAGSCAAIASGSPASGRHRSVGADFLLRLRTCPGVIRHGGPKGRAGQARRRAIRRAKSDATAFSGASSESVPRLRRILRCGPTRPLRPPRRHPSR